MDDLRQATGLSPSGAVRLVDRLEADGLVRRRPGRDGRGVALVLTPAGHRAARRVLDARRRCLAGVLDRLSAPETAALAGVVERLIAAETAERLEAREEGRPPAGWLCRLCDATACGRPDGRCPVA